MKQLKTVYMYVCIYTYVYSQTYIHTYIRMYIHKYVLKYLHIYRNRHRHRHRKTYLPRRQLAIKQLKTVPKGTAPLVITAIIEGGHCREGKKKMRL